MLKFTLPNQLEEESIKILDLSTRSENALYRANIRTLNDFFTKDGETIEFKKIRNMGNKCITEIGAKTFKYIFETLEDNQQVPYLKQMAKLNEDNMTEFAEFIEKHFALG